MLGSLPQSGRAWSLESRVSKKTVLGGFDNAVGTELWCGEPGRTSGMTCVQLFSMLLRLAIDSKCIVVELLCGSRGEMQKGNLDG